MIEFVVCTVIGVALAMFAEWLCDDVIIPNEWHRFGGRLQDGRDEVERDAS